MVINTSSEGSINSIVAERGDDDVEDMHENDVGDDATEEEHEDEMEFDRRSRDDDLLLFPFGCFNFIPIAKHFSSLLN